MAAQLQGTPWNFTVEGTELHIVVDLTHDGGPSKSGKSTVIATTGAPTMISGGIKLGLNVFGTPLKAQD